MRFMGLDLGGSGARAAAFASNGSLLAGAKGRSAPDEGLPLFAAPPLLRAPVRRGQHQVIRERKVNRRLHVIYIRRRVALRLATTVSLSLSREEIPQCIFPIAPRGRLAGSGTGG